MKLLDIIDVKVELPQDITVDVSKPLPGVFMYTLAGASVDAIRAELECYAAAKGYSIQKSSDATHMIREDQRISVIATRPLTLAVTVDDPQRSPIARVSGRQLILGSLALNVDVGSIVPQRERHHEGAKEWSAEWWVVGADVHVVVLNIFESLMRVGLASGGVWPPAQNGIQRFRIQASSATMFVSVNATPSEAHLSIRVELVQSAGNG